MLATELEQDHQADIAYFCTVSCLEFAMMMLNLTVARNVGISLFSYQREFLVTQCNILRAIYSQSLINRLCHFNVVFVLNFLNKLSIYIYNVEIYSLVAIFLREKLLYRGSMYIGDLQDFQAFRKSLLIAQKAGQKDLNKSV